MAEHRIISEDKEKVYKEMITSDGHKLRFWKMKATGQIYFNAEDLAEMRGYKDQHDFLSSDEGLEAVSMAMKSNSPGPAMLRVYPGQEPEEESNFKSFIKKLIIKVLG